MASKKKNVSVTPSKVLEQKSADNVGRSVESAKPAEGKAAPVSVAATPVKAAVAAPAPVAVATPAIAAPVTAAPAAAAAVRTEGVRDRSTIVSLIAKLRDSDADVARDAAETIGSLPADAEAIDALCALVRNVDGYFHPVVRAAAAKALGKLGDRRAVDALIVATGDSMAEASEEAVKALGLLGDRRAAATLSAIERNENGFFLEPVRKTASAALRQLK